MKYVDAIRVAPLRPYTLYNSWYDLRSPEYPKVPKEHWMSERSALGMVKLLRDNMIEKHNIKLDAFVLDDGWDSYESDWLLREGAVASWPQTVGRRAEENEYQSRHVGRPHGRLFLQNETRELDERTRYEIVGKSPRQFHAVSAGTNYSELFRKRVTDFVVNEGVGC